MTHKSYQSILFKLSLVNTEAKCHSYGFQLLHCALYYLVAATTVTIITITNQHSVTILSNTTTTH